MPYGTPRYDSLSECILYEDLVAGCCSLREVDTKDLVNKINAAPNSLLNKMCADFREAWRFHQKDFLQFIGSQTYSFSRCDQTEAEEVWVPGAELADGAIVVDRIPSYVPKSDVHNVIWALRKVKPNGRKFIEEEVCFPEEIGNSKCVQTNADDDIVFAQRTGRKGLTRFVRGRKPEPSNKVFVVLKREREHRYVLITGFVGGRPQPEPWDETAFSHASNPTEAKRLSDAFWANHALIFSPEMIVPGTETDVSPSV